MSEYQYYEFQTVDEPLDDVARHALRSISTRARITPTSFVNEYHWGDLKADPRTLTERYFDAFLYTANWGTRRLILRLPARLLGLRTAQQYCTTDLANAWTTRGNVLVELWHDGDGGEDWDGTDLGEGRLASIIPVRADLADGDLRLLYLGWLLSVQAAEVEDDTPEPPVPPGLGRLTGPLRAVADFLQLDPDLITAAAERSDDTSPAIPKAELARRIGQLPAKEKDALLVRLLEGDIHLRPELHRRLTGPAVAPVAGARRTAAELLDAARHHRLERERLAAQRHAREKQRRDREAAAARDIRLNQLAHEGEHAWQRVTTLIATTKPRDYDTAVHLLGDLRDLAARDGTRHRFDQRVLDLRQQYPNRPAFLRRLDTAGLPSH